MLVHCSQGSTEVAAGMHWRDELTGTQWEVVEPTGDAIYSPSGIGGTPCFWCKPVAGDAPKQWANDAREDGCISFCGDSIAASIMRATSESPYRTARR